MSSVKRKHEDLEEDSDEDQPAYGKQILPVANLPDDFNEAPMDGLQYLFTVRRAARQLPDIARAPNPYEQPEAPVVDMSSGDKIRSASCLPSDEWREMFELRFQNFRKNFNQPTIHVGPINEGSRRLMPEKKDRDMWWAFLSGQPESDWLPSKKSKGKAKTQYPSNSHGMRAWADEPRKSDYFGPVHDSWQNNDEGEVEQVLRGDPAETLPSPAGTPVPLEYLEEMIQPSRSAPIMASTSNRAPNSELLPREPTTTLLKHVDDRMALHLLMYFTHWIQLYLKSPEQGLHLPTESHARWIFCLLSRVDDYVSADDMHLLRNLARACLELLKNIKVKAQQPSLSPTSNFPKMGENSCWLIITIVVDIWKQRDLWMDAESMLSRLSA